MTTWSMIKHLRPLAAPVVAAVAAGVWSACEILERDYADRCGGDCGACVELAEMCAAGAELDTLRYRIGGAESRCEPSWSDLADDDQDDEECYSECARAVERCYDLAGIE